jgi:hypothetical protein
VDKPGGPLRELERETRRELQDAEQHDTGGQEHASRADREGIPAERRPVEAATRDVDRVPREQSDADRLRAPRGDAVTGAGGNMTRGPTPPGPAEPEDK